MSGPDKPLRERVWSLAVALAAAVRREAEERNFKVGQIPRAIHAEMIGNVGMEEAERHLGIEPALEPADQEVIQQRFPAPDHNRSGEWFIGLGPGRYAVLDSERGWIASARPGAVIESGVRPLSEYEIAYCTAQVRACKLAPR